MAADLSSVPARGPPNRTETGRRAVLTDSLGGEVRTEEQEEAAGGDQARQTVTRPWRRPVHRGRGRASQSGQPGRRHHLRGTPPATHSQRCPHSQPRRWWPCPGRSTACRRSDDRVVRLVIVPAPKVGHDVRELAVGGDSRQRVGVHDVEVAVVLAGARDRARLDPADLREVEERLGLSPVVTSTLTMRGLDSSLGPHSVTLQEPASSKQQWTGGPTMRRPGLRPCPFRPAATPRCRARQAGS